MSTAAQAGHAAAELSAHTGNLLVHQKYFSKVIQINSGLGRDASWPVIVMIIVVSLTHVMPSHNIYDGTLNMLTQTPGISDDELSVLLTFLLSILKA